MSAISSVAPPQPFTQAQPSTPPSRTTGNTQPDQAGSTPPAHATTNGRVLNITA